MKSKSFIIEELVPRSVYNLRGDSSWELIDERLIETIDIIKERFPKGRLTINNWKWNGPRQWSGLRTKDSAEYSPTSQHSLGKAIDAVFSEYSAEEIREDIIKNPEIYKHITGIEHSVSWLHIDVRNYDGIKRFGK